MKKMIAKIKDWVEYIVDMYFRDPLFWLGVFGAIVCLALIAFIVVAIIGACHDETVSESTARNLWWTMYNVQRIINH